MDMQQVGLFLNALCSGKSGSSAHLAAAVLEQEVKVELQQKPAAYQHGASIKAALCLRGLHGSYPAVAGRPPHVMDCCCM